MTGTPRGGRAIFRLRDFKLYLAARFLWILTLQMQTVAVAWLVYDRTHEPFALGLIGLAAFLPALPMSLITGAVADRFDRRRVLIATYAATMLAQIAFLALSSAESVWPAYALVMALGVLRAFGNPAAQAMMTNITPPAEYVSAAAWTNTFNQMATILGPSLGGLLYPFGAREPFVTALGFMTFALVCSVRISPRRSAIERAGVKAGATFGTLLAGYRFIWGSPLIFGAITLDLVAVLLGDATGLLPIYANDVFHVGPWGLGLLRSCPAVGSIAAAIVLAHAPLSRGVGKALFSAVIVYGCATLAFSVASNVWVGMACLVVIGAADVVSVVIRQSLVQLDTPDAMRGRVVAVQNILTSASNNLGDFESGTLASFIGAPPAIAFGGGCAIIAALAWMWFFPNLRDRERLAS